MDLEQLGYFIYMDECEKAQQKKQQAQQEQEEETEVPNQKQVWQGCEPRKYGMRDGKSFCPVIYPRLYRSNKFFIFQDKRR